MFVSFSAAAKSEICRAFPNKSCCALAEAFGVLLYCNSFTCTLLYKLNIRYHIIITI